MLVLSRKVGERIVINDNVTVTVVRISGDRARLGIDAPREMLIVRDDAKPPQEKPAARLLPAKVKAV